MEIQRQNGPKNQLELLPDEFTREEYYQMRRSQGKSVDEESLKKWVTRGYIYRDAATGRYCKTEKYLKRVGKP